MLLQAIGILDLANQIRKRFDPRDIGLTGERIEQSRGDPPGVPLSDPIARHPPLQSAFGSIRAVRIRSPGLAFSRPHPYQRRRMPDPRHLRAHALERFEVLREPLRLGPVQMNGRITHEQTRK